MYTSGNCGTQLAVAVGGLGTGSAFSSTGTGLVQQSGSHCRGTCIDSCCMVGVGMGRVLSCPSGTTTGGCCCLLAGTGGCSTGACSLAVRFFVKPVGVFSGIWTGVYFLKNLLFLRVILLEPYVITLYCLVSGCICIITPLLSHCLGLFPSWFWIIT